MSTALQLLGALGSTLCFVLVDYLSVRWWESNSNWYVPSLLVVSFGAYYLFGWVGQVTSLSVTSGLINTGIVIGSIIVGIFIRHDVLDVQQKIGLLFAIVAVGLLTIHR